MEAHLLKDLIELGAEVSATGFNNFYKETTRGDINAPTILVKIPVTRFKFDNRFGCRPVIPEADPTNAMAGLQKQAPRLKTKATTPIGDTSEVVPGPLPFELNEGELAMAKHNHNRGNLALNSGGAGGQVEQVMETPCRRT